MIAILLKSTLVLVVLLAFYKLVLERESYFAANRWYLLACIGLACALPFISIPKIIDQQGRFESFLVANGLEEETKDQLQNPLKNKEPETLTEVLSDFGVAEEDIPEELREGKVTSIETYMNEPVLVSKSFDWLPWVIGLYLFGAGVFLLKLLFEVGSTWWKAYRHEDRVEDEEVIIINLQGEVAPCSFFRYIFINPGQYDFDTYEQILEHEKIHVKQGHSWDLLLAELLVAVCWFNPLAWKFRNEIEKNIEYQTDDLLVRGEAADREQYQLNLVKVASPVKPLSITTNYNQSLIKKRILKMNNKRSNPFGYWKYSFVAPLVFALLVLLNEPGIGNQIAPEIINQSSQIDESIPDSAPAETREEILPSVSLPLEGCGALTQAARDGNANKVKSLLEKTDANCVDPNPGYDVVYSNGYRWQKSRARTPLTAAARHGYLDIAKILIEAGAEVDYDAGDHGSAMTEAAGGGYNDILELFLGNGGDINERSQGQGTPLNAAARNGYEKTVSFLLDKGADIDYQNDGQGTALNAAARNGYDKVVSLLLEKGADINRQNDGQGTALNAAARNGHVEVAKMLLDNGADIDRQNDGQGTPLNAAARNGHNEMVALLLERGADADRQNDGQGSALNAAARNGHVETVKLLLDAGADVDLHNDGQGSALNAAARNEHLEVAKLLIERGADVNRQTDGQGTALNAAARNAHNDMIKLLLDNGADIDRQNDGQGSALNAAARNGHVSTAKLLIERGADINRQNDGQGSPLNAAARNGHMRMVKLLIEKGARINQYSDGQGTALTAASRNDHRNIVKYLIAQGAER